MTFPIRITRESARGTGLKPPPDSRQGYWTLRNQRFGTAFGEACPSILNKRNRLALSASLNSRNRRQKVHFCNCQTALFPGQLEPRHLGAYDGMRVFWRPLNQRKAGANRPGERVRRSVFRQPPAQRDASPYRRGDRER